MHNFFIYLRNRSVDPDQNQNETLVIMVIIDFVISSDKLLCSSYGPSLFPLSKREPSSQVPNCSDCFKQNILLALP